MSLNEVYGLSSEKDRNYYASLEANPKGMDVLFRKAQYASMKRLISCLVNERFLEASLFHGEDQETPKMVMLKPQGEGPKTFTYYMNLLETPYIDSNLGIVTLLDPDECGPTILENIDGVLVEIRDPVQVARRVLNWHNADKEKTHTVCEEIANSVECQVHLYQFPPKDPTLESTILEWEQSLIEGHATHPMHRSRYTEPPMASLPPQNDVFEVTVNFLAVKRSAMILRGPYEDTMKMFLKRLSIEKIDLPNEDEYVIFPVHHLQLPNLFLHFPEDIRLLPFTAKSMGQASLRTLNLDDFPEFSLKLALGVITTSSKRTITPWTSFIGPGLQPILNAVIKDNEKLIVAKETSSALSNLLDINVAKHMAAIFRESIEYLTEGRNEIVIPCMALTELSSRGIPRVCEIFELDTVDLRIQWFQSYARVILEVLIPPQVEYGFTFEAHAQNMLLRVDSKTKDITGFVVRDFGGFKCHQETLKRTTGLWMETIRKGGCAEAKSLDAVNLVAFHTLIQSHLYRFVRALDLHYNGQGKNIIRNILTQFTNDLDKNAPNYDVLIQWLNNPQMGLKCFIKMKLETLERDYLYQQVPNILY